MWQYVSIAIIGVVVAVFLARAVWRALFRPNKGGEFTCPGCGKCAASKPMEERPHKKGCK